MTRTAMIDVGGGYRSIFGVGVMDRMAELGLTIDHGYGISAGSANIFTFLCKQPGRSYTFYTQYAFRKEYASPSNFFHDRNFVNLDYIYGTLSNHDGEYPADYEAFEHNPADFTVVACNANTGHPTYFGRDDISQDHYETMMASSAVPVANKAYMINGVPYFDGGLADPVPVQKALDDGADRVILILTHEYDFVRQAKKDAIPAAMLHHSYPAAAYQLKMRFKTYNDEVNLAKRYEAQDKVLVLAPSDLCGLDTLSKNLEGLERMYQLGRDAAERIPAFLER